MGTMTIGSGGSLQIGSSGGFTLGGGGAAPPGPVALVKYNQTSTTQSSSTWSDLSSNHYDMSMYGSPSVVDNGGSDKYYVIDNPGNETTVKYGKITDAITAPSGWTVVTTVNPTPAPITVSKYAFFITNPDGIGCGISWRSTINRLLFVFNGVSHIYPGTYDLNNSWNTFATSYDPVSGTQKGYLNGTLLFNDSSIGVFDPTIDADTFVGTVSPFSNLGWRGKISRFAIYSGALTDAEVAALVPANNGP